MKLVSFVVETVGAIAVYNCAKAFRIVPNQEVISSPRISWRKEDIDKNQSNIVLSSLFDGATGFTALVGYYTLSPIVRNLFAGYPLKFSFSGIGLKSLKCIKTPSLLMSVPIFLTINAMYIGTLATATCNSRLKTTPTSRCGSGQQCDIINYGIYDANQLIRRILINPIIDEYFFHLVLFCRLVPIAGVAMAHAGSSLAYALAMHGRPSETRASIMTYSPLSELLSNLLDSMFHQCMYYCTGRIFIPVLHHIGCNMLYWWCEEGAQFKLLEHSHLWQKYVYRQSEASLRAPLPHITSAQDLMIEQLCLKSCRLFGTPHSDRPGVFSPSVWQCSDDTNPPPDMTRLDLYGDCSDGLCPEDAVDFVYAVQCSVNRELTNECSYSTSSPVGQETRTRVSRQATEAADTTVGMNLSIMERHDLSHSIVINHYPRGMTVLDMKEFVKLQVGRLCVDNAIEGRRRSVCIDSFLQHMRDTMHTLRREPGHTSRADCTQEEETADIPLLSTSDTMPDEKVAVLIDNYYFAIARAQLRCASILRARVSSETYADPVPHTTTSISFMQTSTHWYSPLARHVALPDIPGSLWSDPSIPSHAREQPEAASRQSGDERHQLHCLLSAVARRSAVQYLDGACGHTIRRFNMIQRQGCETSPVICAIVKKWKDYFTGGQYEVDMRRQLGEDDN